MTAGGYGWNALGPPGPAFTVPQITHNAADGQQHWDRDLSAQVAALCSGEDVREQVTRILSMHRRVSAGLTAWLCSCGHEGDEAPEAHLADVLHDAGLLADAS